MKRLLEFGKTLLIIALLCTLVLLAVVSVPTDTIRNSPQLSRYLQPLAPLLGKTEAELAYVETVLPALDAAQPVAISVSNPMGRSTAMWDFTALDTAFETYGGLLGQALDTAELFTETNDAQLRKALSGSSVYFRYGCSLPVSVLASWLGAELDAPVPDTDSLLLSAEGDGVALYLLGDPCFRSVTQISAEDLEAVLEQARPDGSRFAFEDGSPLAELSLLPGGSVSAAGVTLSNPCDNRYIDQLATELGFNPYGETRFTDDEGTTYFSEANATLEVSTAGILTLTASSGGRFAASGTHSEELIEQARQLVDIAVGSLTTDGRIYLSGLHRQNDTVICTFDYLVDGIPVSLSTGNAAKIVFDGQAVASAEIQVLSFRYSGETLYPLPVSQAAAILPEGSRLSLEYRPSSNALSVGWRK